MPPKAETLGINIKLGIDGDFQKLLDTINKSFASLKIDKLDTDIKNLQKSVKNLNTGFSSLTGISDKQFATLQARASSFGATLDKTAFKIASTNEKVIKAFQKIDEYNNKRVLPNRNGGLSSEKSILAEAERLNRAYDTLHKQKANAIAAMGRLEGQAAEEDKKRTARTLQNQQAAQKLLQSQRERSLAAMGRLESQAMAEDARRTVRLTNMQQSARAALQKQRESSIAAMGRLEGQAMAEDTRRTARAVAAKKRELDEMNRLHGQALEMNKRFDSKKGGNSIFNISPGDMAQKLAEFYLIRTAMFAVANSGREAVATVIDLNQAIHDTAAISGSSVAEMMKFKTTAFEIAKTSKFGVMQVMEMTKILAQAGIAGDKLPETTKYAAMFATGTGSTAQQSVDLMTTAMNAWGLQAEDSARIVNTMTAALNASKLEAGGLSTAFNYLASQASTMNISLEETNGIIAAYSNMGVKTSTIGTGVSGLLTQFAAPKPRFAKLLKEYGVSFDEINPQMNSFAEIIGRLEKAAIPVDKILANMDARIARSLVVALNVGRAGFERMTEAVSGTDAAFIASAKAMDGGRAKLNILKSTFVQSADTILSKLKGLDLAFSVLKNVFTGAGTSGGGIAAAIAVVATGVVGLAAATVKAGGAVALLTKAFAILKLEMLTNPYLLLGAAIISAGAALWYFGKKQNEVAVSTEDFTRRVAASLGKVQEARMGLLSMIGEISSSDYNKNAKETDALFVTEEQYERLRSYVKDYPELKSKLDETVVTRKTLYDIEKGITAEMEAQKRLAYAEANSESVGAEQRLGFIASSSSGAAVMAKLLQIAKSKGFEGDELTAEAFNMAKGEFSTSLARRGTRGYNTREFLATRGTMETLSELYGTLDKANAKQMALPGATVSEVGRFGAVRVLPRTPFLGDKNKSTYNESSDTGTSYGGNYKSAIDDFLSKYALGEFQKAKLAAERVLKQQMLVIDAKSGDLSNEITAYDAALKANEMKFRAERDGSIAALEKDLLAASEEARKNLKGLALQGKLKELNDAADAYSEAAIKAYVEGVAQGRAEIDRKFFVTPVSKERLKALQSSEAGMVSNYDAAIKGAWTGDDVDRLTALKTQGMISSRYGQISEYASSANDIRAKMAVAGAGATPEEIKTATEAIAAYDAEIEKLNGDINKLYSELEALNNNQLPAFIEGMKQGALALGSTSAITRQLGQDVFTGVIDGLTNSISGMVGALAQGQSAWVSFRNGLGNMLGDIGKMLTNYILKLLAVYAVQKLVGVFAPSANPGALNVDGLGSSVGNMGSLGGIGVNSNVMQMGGFADGGFIPNNIGVAGVDSVPAMLMPGEFVIKKSAVDKYGINTFSKLNAMRFADGGLVPGGTSASPSGEVPITVSVINVVDPRSIPKTSENEILNVIRLDAINNGATTRTIKARVRGEI